MLQPATPLSTLEKPPSTREVHVWADYIELLCLVSIDQEISKADVLDRVRERRDLDEPDDASLLDDSAVRGGAAEHDDRFSTDLDDIFAHLVYREGTFKDAYPFTIGQGRVLRVKASLAMRHRLYIFFLLSANLRYLPRSLTSKLTSDFELLSAEVLRACLPSGAEVHVFGSNALHSAQPRYAGRLWNKIQRLAADLHERPAIPETEFKPTDTGDNGLDIVGWVPAGDKAGGFFLVFGQCACTEDWVSKQHSSSAEQWRATMSLLATPSNMVFVPYCFRQSNGEWLRRHDIHGTVLIDRPRFVYYLPNGHEILTVQPSNDIVGDLLKQRESLE